MKLADEVSSDKLRGGFYTPPDLVNVCLERLAKQLDGRRDIALLEPSVGDGAFLQGLKVHNLRSLISTFVGLEIIEEEAQKCREKARNVPFETTIRNVNTLEWIAETDAKFDAIVGNPPFLRYQFVPKAYLKVIERIGDKLDVSFRGVSNLWIPMLLGSLNCVSAGGTMAMVVPAEIFTGVSAGEVRGWLLQNFQDLQIDSFPPGIFPGVLQEVVVLSGRRVNAHSQVHNNTRRVRFVEHDTFDDERSWVHEIKCSNDGWTQYLLTPAQVRALHEAKSLRAMQSFGNVAKLEVSIVTGANDYFSVKTEELEYSALHPWAEPLLPRIRHAKGLVYTREDHVETAAKGAKAWLLHFGSNHPDPLQSDGAYEYIKDGEARGLNRRYKTSIREPWFRVPSVWAGRLLLSKRSHWFPQLILNEAKVLTTDTIYRGRLWPFYEGREGDLVGAFHNSLTLLTAEIEGRSFGGGVLELVPSEIARLTVPFPINLSDELAFLDRKARARSEVRGRTSDLIEATDKIVCQRVDGLTRELMDDLREARETLSTRRLLRNSPQQ